MRIILMLLFLCTSCFSTEWPTSILTKACKDVPCWRIGNYDTFIVIDCSGNLWWFKTSGSNKTSSIIEEQLLYTAKDIIDAVKVMKDTIQQHNIPVEKKSWMDDTWDK